MLFARPASQAGLFMKVETWKRRGSDGRSAQGEIRARTATRELQETIEPTGFDYALASTHLATASSIAVRDCGMPHMEERLIP